MTNQPTWKTIYDTDTDTLRVDETGVYDPELDVSQDDEDSGKRYTYTICLERLFKIEDEDSIYYVTQTISEGYKAGTLPHKEWFLKDLSSVADSVGSSRTDLLTMLCSDDPKQLAHAYGAIAGFHGLENFDSDPWITWIDKMAISLSTSDDDDGMVTVCCGNQERATEDQSIEGSNWECPGDMDVAYASICDRVGLVAALEAQGYEVDDSEYSEPTDEDIAHWGACNVAANAGLPKPERPTED